jgi:KAP P-loop domain protein
MYKLFGIEKKLDELFSGAKEKLYNSFEKNQFKMLLYYGINLLILLLLLKNFSKIENFYKQLSGNVNDGYKFIILIPLSIFAIYIGNYKIVHKSLNKNLFFIYSVFAFQIFSIDTKNNTINKEIVISILILFMILSIVNLYRIQLKKDEKSSMFWIIIIIESFFLYCIFSFIIINQIDVFKIMKEIYIENKKISNLKFIYFIFKLLNLILLVIFVIFKVFPNIIEKKDLKRIEKISSSQIGENKIKKINNDNNVWKFKNQAVKEEFISNLKNEFENEYDIYYKKDVYYFCLFHFLVNIEIIKWVENLKKLFLRNSYENYKYFFQNNSKYLQKYIKIEKLNRKKMVIIDRTTNNNENFEKLKNKFDMLVILSLEENMFKSRLDSLERLKEEIYLAEKSILIDDNWGNGKTFFIKKFMEIYNKDFEFIYIKVPYFDNKKEFRKKILTEIYRAFKKNKIITSSLKELMSYFNVNIQKFDLGFISFDFNKLLSDNSENDYSEILIDIKNNLAYLEKKIIIILDDFDRVENKSQIIEVLNFIGELNIELSESITLITLSSYKKLIEILEKEEALERKLDGKKYLEKYFDKIFHLSSSNFFELVDFFSDIYNLNIERVSTLKEIGIAINSRDKRLLSDNNITFRNIERLIKNLKKINIEGIEKKFKDIYEKVFIFWEIVEYLIPESWDEFKVVEDINIDENALVTSFPLYNIILDKLKWGWKLDEIVKFEKKEIFIHSILEAVRKYKLSKYKEPLFHYLNIRNEILNLNSKYKLNISYKDYKEINNMFKFTIENRKVIFNFLMKDKNITQCELLNLMIEYRINYKWNYDDCENFFKDLERNRNEGAKIPRTHAYIFIKHLLLVNSFIDMKKIKSSESLEKRLLFSQEEIYNFFKDFVIETKKDECYLFINKIFNIAIDAKFYIGNNTPFDKKKNHMESLKKELVNAQYLINEDDKSIESIKYKIQTVKNKFDISDLDEIINFLKENHNELYEIWENYLQKIRK